ncbi:MAG: hypothetical protein ACSHYF_18360 [Verrucomicrobiaceae bacterium]
MFKGSKKDSEIRGAQSEIGRAKSAAERASDEVKGLQRQVDHLTLVCQSMWELLREKNDLSDGILRAKIADVDTRDGKADGKIHPQIFPCPKCSANCNTTRQTCAMCGEDLKACKPHIFEA